MGQNDGVRSTFSKNHVLEALSSGGVVHAAPAKLHSPTVIELYGDVGLDCAFIDYEHTGPSPWDSSHMEDLQRAADVSGIELLVRLPVPDAAMVRKTLDTGVRNIIVPRVKTADEVRRVVKAARFVYNGEPGDRGIGAARANNWESFREDENYIEREDSNTMVAILIETKEAVKNIDEILSVDGIGLILIGHIDLALALGHSLDPEVNIRYPHRIPEMVPLTSSIIQKVDAAGIPYGKVPADIDDARDAIDDGYQFLLHQNELDAIRELFGEKMEALNEELGSG